MENVIFTNMCMIYDNNGNVLVQDRKDPSWPGIAFPGGHVEQGESFADSVVREVFEETGLMVSNLQICGFKDFVRDDGVRYVVILYKTDCFTGELKSSDEGEVFWVKYTELESMPLTGDFFNTVKVFSDEYTEHFFCKENDIWKEYLK